MTDFTHPLLSEAATALALPARVLERVAFVGDGALPSAYAVTDVAAAAFATAAVALRELLAAAYPGDAPAIVVDRRLASLWFGVSIRPQGWSLPAPWDAIAGDYEAADGWIRLHTNAPAHRAAALAALGLGGDADRARVASAVRGWTAGALEDAIVAGGGCAAEMRSPAQWADHPQGRAVAAEPLVAWKAFDAAAASGWAPHRERPLAGLKVLDLTRVLAGPVATRWLAGHGADVLRIDPPGWDEPGLVPDVTLGKRCARLDLRQAADRAAFEGLLAEADVLVHGYRPGALDALGYPSALRRRLNPALVEATLDAYGWSGPWRGRRGFDSLVQMSTGIAQRGQQWRAVAPPVPLPVQALDHATGYLIAAAVVRGLLVRLTQGRGNCATLSLARTAAWLASTPEEARARLAGAADEDFSPGIERTPWGPAQRLRPAATIAGVTTAWARPAAPLGSAKATWNG